ncbi:MAG: hypothetical protein ACP5VS_14235, partial [Desulfomonilaceae bacterium]
MDGQQRLTTLALILVKLYHLAGCSAMKNENQANQDHCLHEWIMSGSWRS